MVLAGWRSTGENEAVAELNLVPLAEECQEFRESHVLRRAGVEPGTGPEFARHDVGERPGCDALRIFGDERNDFMPVNLFGGHAGSLPPARRRGTERKCWRCEKRAPIALGVVPVVWYGEQMPPVVKNLMPIFYSLEGREK